MSTQVRSGVFETNSSSEHSLSMIDMNSDEKPNFDFTIVPDKNGLIVIRDEPYYDESSNDGNHHMTNPMSKAAFIAEELYDHLSIMKDLIEVIQEHTGAKEVQIKNWWNSKQNTRDVPDNDVDDRSTITGHYITGEAVQSKEHMKAFLFDSTACIIETED